MFREYSFISFSSGKKAFGNAYSYALGEIFVFKSSKIRTFTYSNYNFVYFICLLVLRGKKSNAIF